MSYARTTTVSIERSRLEIERYLAEKGAAQFMSALDHQHGRALIGWTLGGRMVRIEVALPDPQADEFTYRRTALGYASHIKLPADTARARWEQAARARWRAILLILKAKFEAVEAGISTFEREFLADTVMANGQTLGAWVAPQLESMYASGHMPALLPAPDREVRG